MSNNDFSQLFASSTPSSNQTPKSEPQVLGLQRRGINLRIDDVTTSAISVQVVKALEPVINRLTAEIQSLRSEVQQLKKRDCPIRKIMPAKPFNNMEQFNAFEKLLQENRDAFSSFQKELQTVSNNNNFVKNCWRKIITDQLGEKMCWKGTEEKRSIRNLSSALAVRNATTSLGKNEEEFIRNTKSFFQFAKNRQKQRAEYKQNINKKDVTIVLN